MTTGAWILATLGACLAVALVTVYWPKRWPTPGPGTVPFVCTVAGTALVCITLFISYPLHVEATLTGALGGALVVIGYNTRNLYVRSIAEAKEP